MDSEDYLDPWIGYDPVLQNGTPGSLQELERRYDQGEIGDLNTVGINLERAVMLDEIAQVDPEKEELDEEKKVLYSHPSNVPYPSGTAVGARYFGGSAESRVSDSAVLIVKNQPPIENMDDLEQVRSFLIGDKQDQKLEGKGLGVQVYPFTA